MTPRPAIVATVLTLSLLSALLLACGDDRLTASHASDPAWWEGETLYQITVSGFSEDGTLAGVIPHLDGLRDLGIRVLVLNPIHPAGGAVGDSIPAHPYAPRDHLAVDPALGDVPAFTALCEAAHARGMRVVLDMLLNHGAVDHVAIDRHPDWFRRDAAGQLTRKVGAWRTVADLDHDHAGVRAYVQEMLATWADRGADGFRCLHANLQGGDFWRGVLADLHRTHPDLFLCADSRDPRHLDEGFDAILRPQFLEAASFAYLDDCAQLGLDDDIWHAVRDTADGTVGRGVIFLEDRFSKRAVETFPWPRGAGYAAALLTLPGHPQLSAGQEWGCAEPARLLEVAPLDRTVRHTGWGGLYRSLLRLRAASEAIRRGTMIRVPEDDRELLLTLRETGDERVLVAANLSGSSPRLELPEDLAGSRWCRWEGDAFEETPSRLSGEVRVEPYGWAAWREVR
jgi:glycosidase